MLETTGQENILVIGQTGSGKSSAVADLINYYSSLKKEILLIGLEQENTNYNSNTIKSISCKVESGERIGEEEISRSFSKETFDVVVVDEIHLLSDTAKDKLFRLILSRPGIKFVIIAQNWREEYRDKKKCFAKAFAGKIVISDIDQLSYSLGISMSDLEPCSQIDDYSFVCFDISVTKQY